VTFTTDGYLISCYLHFYEHSFIIPNLYGETKDWFYKSNLFYEDNDSNEIKLTTEGIKYLNILEKVMIELINRLSKY